MILDDPGTAQNVWLEHWHYPALSQEVIDQYLIQPFKKRDAILNINFVPGFVNDQKRRVEPSWSQKFVDEFGTSQDYTSAKKGFDRGVEEGVFEVLCHGLTHMQPDLASPPNGHDFGIATDPEKFATIFDTCPDASFISINEFIAYLHSCNSGQMKLDKSPQVSFEIEYDPHYCQHFKGHSSMYMLELADWVSDEFDKDLHVKVDGEIISLDQSTLEIEIPAGIGVHTIEINDE